MRRLCILTLALALSMASSATATDPDLMGAWTLLPYGASNPVLNCMPLGACLVALEDGETIEGRFLPDSARWQVEIGTAGPSQRIPVLAIKPNECGISTNLFVTTSRRVYTFILNAPPCDPAQISASHVKFDQVRFTYPQEFAKLWDAGTPPPSPPPGAPTGAHRIDQLNFQYSWSAGRRSIKPETVYDDGVRTYIVLAGENRTGAAPAVFVKGDDGNLEAVNFSAPGPGSSTYTVDRVVPQLILVLGPEAHQKTVITKRKAR